jgi:hypothetical protein
MKYIVEFLEKAVVRRLVQCEVEAENEDEAIEKTKDGDYAFIDSWDDDDLSSEFINVESIEEAEDD